MGAGGMRASALASAIAILAIVLISMYAAWHIWSVYVAARSSLAEYAHAAEKPVMLVRGVTMGGKWLTISIVNQGPGSALVHQACIYKYVGGSAPTGMLCTRVERLLGPGRVLELNFTVEDPTLYVWFGRPLRVLLFTDRGLYLLSAVKTVSRLEVNVHLPPRVDADTATLWYFIQCGGGAGSYTLGPSSVRVGSLPVCGEYKPNDTNPLVACRLGKTVVLEALVPAGSACQVYTEAQYDTFVVKGPGQTPVLQVERVKEMYTAYAALEPGQAAHIDIAVPAVEGRTGKVNGTRVGGAQYTVIDFSWLANVGGLRDYSWLENLVTSEVSVHKPSIYEIAKTLVENGVVSVTTDAPWCRVYPSPGASKPPSDLADYYSLFGLRHVTAQGENIPGLPLMVACNQSVKFDHPVQVNGLIQVTIPFYVGSPGKYIIIPVFEYAERYCCNEFRLFKATIRVWVEDEAGRRLAGVSLPESINVSSPYTGTGSLNGPNLNQFSPVLVARLAKGWYRLVIRVDGVLRPANYWFMTVPTLLPRAAVVVVDKVVVIRAPSEAVLRVRVPYAHGIVDISSGAVKKTIVAFLAPVYAGGSGGAKTLEDEKLLYIHLPDGSVSRMLYTTRDGAVLSGVGAYFPANGCNGPGCGRGSFAENGASIRVWGEGAVTIAIPYVVTGSSGEPTGEIYKPWWVHVVDCSNNPFCHDPAQDYWSRATSNGPPSIVAVAPSEYNGNGWLHVTVTVPDWCTRCTLFIDYYRPLDTPVVVDVYRVYSDGRRVLIREDYLAPGLGSYVRTLGPGTYDIVFSLPTGGFLAIYDIGLAEGNWGISFTGYRGWEKVYIIGMDGSVYPTDLSGWYAYPLVTFTGWGESRDSWLKAPYVEVLVLK